VASIVGICNRALQIVGANRILALTDNSREARSCNNAYDPVRLALLRRYTWGFAKTRAVLAPDTTTPSFGYQYQFSLPSDCLRVLLPNDNTLDWAIEGRKILTNGGTDSTAIAGSNLTYVAGSSSISSTGAQTLYLRYIANVTDPNVFDPMFAEAFALKMAVEMCDELTQSNQKKSVLMGEFRDYLSECKLTDSLETVPDAAPVDRWISARY